MISISSQFPFFNFFYQNSNNPLSTFKASGVQCILLRFPSTSGDLRFTQQSQGTWLVGLQLLSSTPIATTATDFTADAYSQLVTTAPDLASMTHFPVLNSSLIDNPICTDLIWSKVSGFLPEDKIIDLLICNPDLTPSQIFRINKFLMILNKLMRKQFATWESRWTCMLNDAIVQRAIAGRKWQLASLKCHLLLL
ncbi:unnamed protein product [Ambrosiozyma monospora]|uniref:Unnamed protein product n=1 Tax=Ambrosiozyma monospora TaxID=43982 RepID=A0A9W6YXG4_AMBMO|nr:unnamed protein product [Ambrosiozyma monospora]